MRTCIFSDDEPAVVPGVEPARSSDDFDVGGVPEGGRDDEADVVDSVECDAIELDVVKFRVVEIEPDDVVVVPVVDDVRGCTPEEEPNARGVSVTEGDCDADSASSCKDDSGGSALDDDSDELAQGGVCSRQVRMR